MILQPQKYLEMMPSKGIRNAVIDGLEVWYQVPDKSLSIIRDIINLLHNSSLMQVHLSKPRSPTNVAQILGWTILKTVLH